MSSGAVTLCPSLVVVRRRSSPRVAPGNIQGSGWAAASLTWRALDVRPAKEFPGAPLAAAPHPMGRRMTLVLGVAASVVANVLHAQDNPISQAIAAWPPLALLLTVELISRVPVHRKSLAFARLAATATIAGIAAWWGRARARFRPFGPVVSLTRPPE